MFMKGRRNDAEKFERSPPEGRHDIKRIYLPFSESMYPRTLIC